MKNLKLILVMMTTFFLTIACNNDTGEITISDTSDKIEYERLPLREGGRPATTEGIPHVQLDLDKVPEVHEEMVERIFSVPGIVNEPSVILSWEGLWIDEEMDIVNPQALISGREFGHIHDDGSLHIFLKPNRAIEVVEKGWAVLHPYAVQEREGWEGFVMLYTPQNMEELKVVLQLIVEAFNYVTGQQLDPKDFY